MRIYSYFIDLQESLIHDYIPPETHPNALKHGCLAWLLLFLLFSSHSTSGQQEKNRNTFSTIFCNSTIDLCKESPWVLIFNDEFDGNTLNTDNWDIINGVPRDPFFTIQKAWHQTENILVSDGSLKIITREEEKNNMQYIVSYDPLTYDISDFKYTSGEIWSKRKFLYGKYEARIKIPKGWGLWPAFWLFKGGEDEDEIDIFEFWNENPISNLAKIQHMTVHFDYNHDNIHDLESTHYIHSDLSDDYHVYTLIYLPGYIKWLVDGNLIYEYDKYYYYYTPLNPVNCQILSGQTYFQQMLYPFPPMNVIFNTAVQYNNNNEPNNQTVLPAQMEIDWFRYYISADNLIVNTNTINPNYLNSETHAAYAADSIDIGTITIPANAKLSLCALNGAHLKPEFTAEYGSELEISVLNLNPAKAEYVDSTTDNNKLHISIQQDNLSGLTISPNPTLDIAIVCCDTELVNNGEILIFSSTGEFIERHIITNEKTEINMRYPSGIYIIAIRNYTNNVVSSFKVIKK